MSNTLRIKRRAQGGASGAPASLLNGELAFNEQDKILYYGYAVGDVDGSAASIIAIGGPGANLAASKLATPVNLQLTGDATGIVSFDGSADTTINVTVSAERVQDIVGGMVVGSANGMIANYDDATGVLALSVADFSITHTGDVTGTATVVDLANVNYALTISAKAVTNAKLADMPSGAFKGRKSAGNGSPEDLTTAEARDMLVGTTNGAAGVNKIFAGPASGASAAPGFRSMVEQDVPAAIARLADPVFTGNVQAPTPANGDNSAKVATTEFVRATRLDQLTAPNASVGFNDQRITGLADPINDTDAANKRYVDNAVQGISHKASVRVASTGNLVLSGTQTIDAVDVVVGDRVLAKDQTNPADNGIYVVAAGAWTRADDADTWGELVSAFTFIEEGASSHDTSWVCSVDEGGALGVDNVTWTQFGAAAGYTAGNGLTLAGSQFSVVAGTGISVGANVGLTGQALALHNLATNGMIARTAAGTVAARTITGTGNQITVTNGNGVGGNPTLSIASTYAGQASITTLGTINTGVWQGSTIDIAYGGTGATTAAGARTSLGLQIGSDVQAHNVNLDALAGLAGVADKVAYFTGAGAMALSTLSAFGRSLIDDADAGAARGTLGLGTMATQNASNVAITGGTVDNVTIDCGTF